MVAEYVRSGAEVSVRPHPTPMLSEIVLVHRCDLTFTNPSQSCLEQHVSERAVGHKGGTRTTTWVQCIYLLKSTCFFFQHTSFLICDPSLVCILIIDCEICSLEALLPESECESE